MGNCNSAGTKSEFRLKECPDIELVALPIERSSSQRKNEDQLAGARRLNNWKSRIKTKKANHNYNQRNVEHVPKKEESLKRCNMRHPNQVSPPPKPVPPPAPESLSGTLIKRSKNLNYEFFCVDCNDDFNYDQWKHCCGCHMLNGNMCNCGYIILHTQHHETLCNYNYI